MSNLESYAHRAAKSVLVGWLRTAAERAGGYDAWATMAGFGWRVNRSGPHFGVWEEYPAVVTRYGCDGITTVWDEIGDLLGAIGDDCLVSPWRDAPPTYASLIAQRTPPACIMDVAVQEKGAVVAAFEIVHKSPPSWEKIYFLQAHGVAVFVLPARWVLGQIAEPRCIPQEFRQTFAAPPRFSRGAAA